MTSKSSRATTACLWPCPAARMTGGAFRDIVHPITPEARAQLEDAILEAYREHLAQQDDAILAQYES